MIMNNLVIVESPAKAKTIEKFLGKDYKVMSSYGHIRDLKKKEISIDMDTLEPDYEVPEEKKKIVSELRSSAKKAQTVWIASDEDREGEAIAWHLCEVLGLDEATTRRIVFHEITRHAILEAIKSPRHIDMNLVNAQQARRVLDRIVGFKLSPVLWKKVKPALSAGRVQSVAVRLIVEREREIQAFKSEPYYRVTAIFTLPGKDNGAGADVKAELDTRFATHDEALAFLEKMKNARFTIADVQKKPLKRSPAPPFTTSTLQQEAARKLGFTVSQTMLVAQHLYESGKITYMRTDSVNLSSLCINACKKEIASLWGENYSRPRQFHTSSKGAQEAHEAIRPTYMSDMHIEGTAQERRLYDLIWKRTAACQMADAQIEKTSATIDITDEGGNKPLGGHFTATGEVVTFDGFLRVYRESSDDENGNNDISRELPAMTAGETLQYKEITATERLSQAPARYSEASLVHKLEELGIGRPSTYAPTISTIQQREYVQKGERKGEERTFNVDTLRAGSVVHEEHTETSTGDKGKLVPTDIGIVVNDFLMKYFPDILDYNFTATVEQEFDKIADGEKAWTGMIKKFYKGFDKEVESTLKMREEHKAGERLLGNDPISGKQVSVKIGRFGPVVQIGRTDDDDKPRFAQIPHGKSLETITLDEALEAFKLPRHIGQFEGSDVVIGTGRFGPYILHEKKYTSLPKDSDPLKVTLDEAIVLITQKREAEKKKHLKKFDNDNKLEIMNGRYGPYIVYDGDNYRLTKAQRAKAGDLTYEECMEIVNASKKKASKK